MNRAALLWVIPLALAGCSFNADVTPTTPPPPPPPTAQPVAAAPEPVKPVTVTPPPPAPAPEPVKPAVVTPPPAPEPVKPISVTPPPPAPAPEPVKPAVVTPPPAPEPVKPVAPVNPLIPPNPAVGYFEMKQDGKAYVFNDVPTMQKVAAGKVPSDMVAKTGPNGETVMVQDDQPGMVDRLMAGYVKNHPKKVPE